MVHGGNLFASMMVDTLLEAHRILGFLPRRLMFKADNTHKETKNYITLFAAIWILAQLEGTKLNMIEFVFLMVGHTHDLLAKLESNNCLRLLFCD